MWWQQIPGSICLFYNILISNPFNQRLSVTFTKNLSGIIFLVFIFQGGGHGP